MLDLVYIASAGIVLFLFWVFAKACDRF